jgi:hypothetical protein
MSHRPPRFTQSDVARAIRAVKQTGADMAVEIMQDGTIRIVPYSGPERREDDQVADRPRVRLFCKARPRRVAVTL